MQAITEYFWEGKDKRRFWFDEKEEVVVQERNGKMSKYGKIEYFCEPYLNTPLDKMKTLQGRQVKSFASNYKEQ